MRPTRVHLDRDVRDVWLVVLVLPVDQDLAFAHLVRDGAQVSVFAESHLLNGVLHHVRHADDGLDVRSRRERRRFAKGATCGVDTDCPTRLAGHR